MTGVIGFNNIPGSGLTAPIFAFEVNSGGQYDTTSRLILAGHKLAAGSLALNTPTAVASQADVDAFAGPGSMLREMYRVAVKNAPVQPIWIEAVAEPSGVAPVWTIPIGTLPGVAALAAIEIQGERISVSVAAADTPTILAANLAAAINAYYNTLTNAMLQVTATSSGANLVLTGRHVGAIMNEIDIYVPTDVVGNVLTLSGVYSLTATTAGTGVPTLSSALAALGDDPADFIVMPWSDSTSTAAYAATTNDQSGRWAYNRQSYGHVWSVNTATFSGATTFGLALNDRHLTALRRLSGCISPSWVWAAGICAAVAPWLSDCVTGNVSRNQTGIVVRGVRGVRDRSLLDQYTARNTLNNSGVSTFTQSVDGVVMIDKIVTTYRTGPLGQPDTVFRDVQSVYQVSGGLGYIRAQLATEQGQKGLADSNPGNLAAITTPADIKGSFVHAYVELCARGVFENEDAFTRNVQAVRDRQNPARVNVYAPMDRVNPLDILATNATIYAQFPAGF
jgi:phage tail sheath gpL-like